jgi:hypothetical protein
MARVISGVGRASWIAAALLSLTGVCTAAESPVNVAAGVFLNELCPQNHVIYQVPADRLLVIEDASAEAFDAATAGDPGAPRIIEGVFTMLSLRTNPNTVNFGTADHVIAAGRGLPLAGGRTMQAYAAPGTEVVYQIKGCTVPLNTQVWFAGRLIDSP